MTGSIASAELGNATSSPGAVRSTPKPIIWWLAGGLGILGAGALAAVLSTSPKTEEPAATELVTKSAPATHVKPSKNVEREAADTKVAAAPVCANCGVVESVRAEKRKGEGSGVGAVAGGVLGGVVGHQIGGGTGKKAMTILGAIGGGVAGHEVEKQVRSVTVYQVQLRMDDGSTRTVTQSVSPALGTRVEVEGNKLKALPSKA